MRKRRWRDLSKTEQAILTALIGSAIVLNPMGGRVVVNIAKYYLKKWWDKGGPYIPPEKDPERVRNSLYYLKRNKYVYWKHDKKKGEVMLAMTDKGKELFSTKASPDNFEIVRPEKWDSQWRFILFDVPEKMRKSRDLFRYYLKNMGFFRFQRSVWIHPFACEKEVQYLSEFLEMTKYIIMFTAKINNDRVLRRYFLRAGILLRRDLSLLDKGLRY